MYRFGRSRQRGWELGQEDLDRLLRHLGTDADTASQRYEALRRRLIDFFAWEQASAPEDLADDTLNRLARRLSEGVDVHGDVRRYALGIARLLLHEDRRTQLKRDAAVRELSRRTPGAGISNTLRLLRACLHELSGENRSLIERYYIEDRAALARSLGISVNALRNRALRIREHLLMCVSRKRDV